MKMKGYSINVIDFNFFSDKEINKYARQIKR